MTKSNLGRPKDNTIKIRVAIDNKQNSSINFSIRLKDGVTKKEAIEKSIEFLKDKLWKKDIKKV